MAAPSENQSSPAWRSSAFIAAGLAALALVIAQLPRAALSLPLYSGDEGSYLIRALYGALLKADPSHAATVADIDNSVFFWIIRGVHMLGGKHYLDLLRVLGGCAYVGGLVLVWRAARPDLNRAEAAGALVLALLYPYYRFVLSALPEGWYVGLLAVIIFLTVRLWRSRPLVHALATGALTAALILIKPHGVAIGAAMCGLIVIDFLFDAQRRLTISAARLGLYVVAFLAVGHLIQFIEGRGPPQGLMFFGHGFYSNIMAVAPSPEAPRIGVVAAFSMTVASMLLAGPPIALGLDRLMARWLAQREGFRFEPRDLMFLLILGGLVATMAMVTGFAVKASAFGASESYRLWGRYFEFFTPLLWISAWSYVREAERLPDRRLLAAGVVLAGFVGLSITLKEAITLFPWDAAGLGAFFIPTHRWAGSHFPSYAFAAGAVAAALVLMLRRAPMLPIWQGLFATLGLISGWQDVAWMSEILPDRAAVVAETGGVLQKTARTNGRIAAFVDDNNLYNNVFLRLEGRPKMILISPTTTVTAADVAPFSMVLVQKPHALNAPGWMLVQPGGKIQVYQRGSLDTPIR